MGGWMRKESGRTSVKHTGFITQPVSGGRRDESLALSERAAGYGCLEEPLRWYVQENRAADVSCR